MECTWVLRYLFASVNNAFVLVSAVKNTADSTDQTSTELQLFGGVVSN